MLLFGLAGVRRRPAALEVGEPTRLRCAQVDGTWKAAALAIALVSCSGSPAAATVASTRSASPAAATVAVTASAPPAAAPNATSGPTLAPATPTPATQAPTAVDTSSELPVHDCAEEPTLVGGSGGGTTIRFANLTSGSVQVFWLDRGQRALFQTLGPSQSFTQSTFATHVWVAADAAGKCRAIYVAEARAGQASVGLAAAPRVTPRPTGNLAQRATADRADELAGSQVHFLYVLPSDGIDEALDVNGTLANSISSIQTWLVGQTGGRKLRVDTFGGAADVTFFRLRRSDAQMMGFGAFVRDQVELELKAAGFNAPNKLYGVYYGGGSTFACGGGAWPPSLPGIVAIVYLKGTPPGATPCARAPLGASATTPGYHDFGILHELLHTMGLVATCAPHHTRRGHSSDDPRDLMYAGDLPWRPSLLDIGHDDYYGHSSAGCPDLAKMPWLTS